MEKGLPDADAQSVVPSAGAANGAKPVSGQQQEKSEQATATKAAKSNKKRQFAPQSASTVKKKSYRKVRLSDAKRYVGRNVRVKRRGRLLEGRLSSWGERKMVLERRRYGGKTEMPINIDEVVGLEVLR